MSRQGRDRMTEMKVLTHALVAMVAALVFPAGDVSLLSWEVFICRYVVDTSVAMPSLDDEILRI